MKRVLVTGATGAIGRRVCERLIGRVHVRATSRHVGAEGPWHESMRWDLAAAVPTGLLDGIDTVIHAAGRAHAHGVALDDDAAYASVNVDGTARLCAAAVEAGVQRIVLVSSVSVLGDGGPLAVAESSAPAPASAYARSKLGAENAVRSAPVASVVLRFPLVYGPGAPGNLRRMVDAILRGRFPPVPGIANRRSMIHIDDAADAIVVAAERATDGSVYTVTDGRAYSTRDIYVWTLAALGRRPSPLTPPAWSFRLLAAAGDVVGRVTGRRAPFDRAAWRKLFGSAEYESSAIGRDLEFVPRRDLRTALPAIVEAARRAPDST